MRPGWVVVGLYEPVKGLAPEPRTSVSFRPVRADDVRSVDEGKITSQFALMAALTEPAWTIEELSMLTYPADLPRVVGMFQVHLPLELRQVSLQMPSFDPREPGLPEVDQPFSPYPAGLDTTPPLMDEPLPEVPGTIPGAGDWNLSEG